MKKLIALLALAAFAVTPAYAASTQPERPASYAKTRAVNCSGALGDWTVLQHANFGDLSGPDQADVVIVGDSILTSSVGEQIAWFAGRGKTLAGSYWSGRPAEPAVDWALSLSTKPKILLFANLTNNLFDPAAVTPQLTRLKNWADAEPKTRLVVVDVQAARPSTALCDQRNSGWINTQIYQVMNGGEVCSWSYGFAQDPNRIPRYLKTDGIHPVDGIGDSYRAAVVGGCVY